MERRFQVTAAGYLTAAAALLMLIILMAAVITGSAAAEPQEDSFVYLPAVLNPMGVVDSYETDFTDDIEPWKAVRWQNGTDFEITHDDGCDSGECGFLDAKVNSSDHYVIASPLILGPRTSYTVTFRAKLNDRVDKAQYGVVYGGDWNGGACPGDNTNSCFNHYYEFRVRYRDDGGEKYLEYLIRRIDEHDGNNIEQGEVLLDWTKATGVDPEGWNKWDVRYRESGHMFIKANNSEQAGSPRDGTYNGEQYFGVFARAGENGDTEAIFDSFKLEVEP